VAFTDRLNLRAPASQKALRDLRKARHIPDDYVDFLSKSNGADGFIGTVPLILFGAEEIHPINIAAAIDEFAPGLIIFASDGGGISYALIHGKSGRLLSSFSMQISARVRSRFALTLLSPF
jgi:hypothetical protein